ncbi:helix-turn-helix domain-containing protein [Sciscionella marina]|uniref:helix-turn-helix domain-containing protein n=1 Tax=Sciscionella marina TaxID=508770 RepID=UPI00037DAD33|nr:helix-turn-helix transcriptional regulator [Sciscionella marina]
MTILLREAIGDRLRHARTSRSRTLRDVSRDARVSLGYLSEVERGRKEASSELLASICEALELPLSELLHNVASDVDALAGVDSPREPVPAEADAAPALEGRMEKGVGSGIEGGTLTPAMSGDFADLRFSGQLGAQLPATAIEGGYSSRVRSGVFVAA